MSLEHAPKTGNTISIGYEPRAAFMPMHNLLSSTSTKAVMVGAHRRAGKTVAADGTVVMNAVSRKSDNAIVSPTMTQSMNIHYANIVQMLKDVPGVVTKRGEALIQVPVFDGSGDTSTIRFFAGTDDGSSSGTRGYGFDLVVLDEAAEIGGAVFENAIFPTLSGRKHAQLVGIGTFRGVDLFYDLHERCATTDGWHSLILPVTETGIIPEDEIAYLRANMSREGFEREYMANRFVRDSRQFIDQTAVRMAQARTLNPAMVKELRKTYPVTIGVDVGLRADKSVITVVCGPAVIDYRVLTQPTAPELARMIHAAAVEHQAHAVAIDIGSAGSAVADILRSMGLRPIEVGFGERPEDDTGKYLNRRAEILDKVRTWTERKDCVLPPGEDILRELTVARYDHNAQGKLVIEAKAQLRKRLGNNSSTDFMDSLACALAVNTDAFHPGGPTLWNRNNHGPNSPIDVVYDEHGNRICGYTNSRKTRAFFNRHEREEIYEPFSEENYG